MSTDAFTALAQEIDTRRYGKYRAIVVDNADPEERARLRLTVPALLGDATSDWALACLPFGGSAAAGLVLLPEVGAEVWAECEQGDISRLIWVGTLYSTAPQKGGPDLGPPTARTLRTPGGQILRLDDADGATGITLHHQSGAEITIVDDGTLTVTDGAGQTVTLDAPGTSLLVEDASGNTVSLSSSGITLDDGQGASIELAGPAVTITASTITLDASSVALGGSGGEPVIKGTGFLTAYATHLHPTTAPGAPTGPAIPTTESQSLSTVVRSA